MLYKFILQTGKEAYVDLAAVKGVSVNANDYLSINLLGSLMYLSDEEVSSAQINHFTQAWVDYKGGITLEKTR